MPDPTRILVVDDCPELTKVIGRLLALRGLESVIAVSGEVALDLLEKLPFDLVLTDQEMPGITGVELTRRIRGLFPTLKVVGMSSAEARQPFLEAGAQRFVLKPFTAAELFAALDVPPGAPG
jgi:CheY-like chemotaxis protein